MSVDMMRDISFELTDNPSKEVCNTIEHGLKDYNSLYVEDENHRVLNVVCRKGKDGEIIGGILGGSYWHNMYIRRFWLHDDYRRLGIGGAALRLAESKAIERECLYSRFETDIPSALMFYMEQGYSIKFELEDFPIGGISFYMEKALTQENLPPLREVTGVEFELQEEPDAVTEKLIEDGLTGFLAADVGEDSETKLTVVCRDGDTIIGGMTGGTSYGGMGIKFFWIDEKYRKRGIGGKIIAMAEAESIERGCIHAFVNTHDFQAPGFYKRMGYRVHSELNDVPPGHTGYFMVKDL